ncbi:MAG: endonuclease/exonuclease/phosphatase family protein [Roseobacter sp.]
MIAFSIPAFADTLRVATFNAELQKRGPGLLLRDIARGEDPQIAAVTDVIVANAPDILVLQGFDYDLNGAALAAFADRLNDAGHSMPYRFAARPNSGLQTGLDLDGDGRTGGPRDAQGYGRFSGHGGVAVLSRFPILVDEVQDFSDVLWLDVPDALRVTVNGDPFPSAEAEAIQRLSSTVHWTVPVAHPQAGRIDLLTFHATPPVFDGPEDRNGQRNHDEIVFWLHYLDGAFGPAPDSRFVLLGDANNDPQDGEGLKDAVARLLADPRLQDPRPRSTGSKEATGDPFDTVDWRDPVPGNLRVSYILPSADWTVADAGVYWPASGATDAETTAAASRHRLVWVDLDF